MAPVKECLSSGFGMIDQNARYLKIITRLD